MKVLITPDSTSGATFTVQSAFVLGYAAANRRAIMSISPCARDTTTAELGPSTAGRAPSVVGRYAGSVK